MSNIVERRWRNLIGQVAKRRNSITRDALLYDLYLWLESFNMPKDKVVSKLYDNYVSWMNSLELSDYKFDEYWYVLTDIIDYDLVNLNLNSFGYPIIQVSHVVYNMITFKSNVWCPKCNDDYLRVLSNIYKDKIYYKCDICLYLSNDNFEPVSLDDDLIPAPNYLVYSYGISVMPL